MYENVILLEVIINGLKFMSIEVFYLKMKFIDFMNFILMVFFKILKVFNFFELVKGYFLYFFNMCDN